MATKDFNGVSLFSSGSLNVNVDSSNTNLSAANSQIADVDVVKESTD